MKMNKERLAKLQDFLKNLGQAETPDEGYHTAQQWADMLGIPRKTFMNRVDKLKSLQSKNLDIKKYGIRCKGGIRKIPHYKFEL
jgi:hypothetical protein